MERAIDHLGRIVIPAQIREALGLTPGSTLNIYQLGDRIILEKVREKPVEKRDKRVILREITLQR